LIAHTLVQTRAFAMLDIDFAQVEIVSGLGISREVFYRWNAALPAQEVTLLKPSHVRQELHWSHPAIAWSDQDTI
jgi:hypothetical protein